MEALLDLTAARSRHAARVAERGARNVALHDRRQAEALAELRRGRVRLLGELDCWPAPFRRRLRERVVRATEPDADGFPFSGHETRGAAVFEAAVPRSRAFALLKWHRGAGAVEYGAERERCVAELRAAVAHLRGVEQAGDRQRLAAARARVSRAKGDLLWTLFEFGRTAPLARGEREA